MREQRSITDFLPALQQAEATHGEWLFPPQRDDGIWIMPYSTLDETADALVQAAYDEGWVRPDFDWMEWVGTDDARLLRSDPDRLARASRDDLAHLLTACIREDRFNEGALLATFNSGLMLRVLLRAKALEEDETGTR